MLLFTTLLLILMLWASRRRKGPLWAFGIAWLISLVPIASGAVRFSYFATWNVAYEATLAALLASFVLGVFWHDHVARKTALPPLPRLGRRDGGS